MSYESFLTFAERAEQAGNPVSPDLITKTLEHDGTTAFEHDQWRSALYAAGLLLNEDRLRTFVDYPLGREILDGHDTIASVAMLGVLNQSLLRNAQSSKNRTFINHWPSKVYACHEAEDYFADMFGDINAKKMAELLPDYETSWPGVSHESGWTLVTDDDIVVGAQKTTGEGHTMLGFEPLVIDGIEYPAGSIYAILLPFGYRYRNSERVAIAGEYVDGMAFARLSPWAYPPIDRQLEFPAIMNQNNSHFLHNATIETLQSLATEMIPFSPNASTAP